MSKRTTFKLGKLPARPNAVRFRMTTYVPKLPEPPDTFGHYGLIKDWEMLGNDNYGNCLAEGTLVAAKDVSAAQRVKYDGPVVSVLLASGKRLTVTPNHAVLTPSGFTRAKYIKHGDYLVGTRGAKVLPGLSGFSTQGNVDDAPAPVEQIFSALALRFGTVRPIVPSAVDFHGDERFFNGNVEVVRANRFLRNESDAALREPHAQDQVSTARHLKSVFVRARAALLSFGASWFSPHRDVCFGGYGPALAHAHSGVTQSQGLSLRAQRVARSGNGFFEMLSRKAELAAHVSERGARDVFLNRGATVAVPAVSHPPAEFGVGSSALEADSRQPSIEGHTTDPQLFGNLCNAFPGLIEADRVISVNVNRYMGTHVYDLSTTLKWYIAEGIITHNCVLAGAAHETMMWTAMRATKRTVTQAEDMFDDAQVLSDYSAVTGFNPADLSTDRGTDMEEAAAYRRKTGILDKSGARHKVAAYLAIRPGDFKRHKVGAYLFGAVGIGIEFPGSAMDQFNRGEPWDVVSGSSIEGGHYIPVVGFTGDMIWVVTWGRLQAMTRRFLEKYNDESVAYVSREMLRKGGASPGGLRIRQLEADLKGLG